MRIHARRKFGFFHLQALHLNNGRHQNNSKENDMNKRQFKFSHVQNETDVVNGVKEMTFRDGADGVVSKQCG